MEAKNEKIIYTHIKSILSEMVTSYLLVLYMCCMSTALQMLVLGLQSKTDFPRHSPLLQNSVESQRFMHISLHNWCVGTLESDTITIAQHQTGFKHVFYTIQSIRIQIVCPLFCIQQ